MFVPDPIFFHPGSRIRIFSIPGNGSEFFHPGSEFFPSRIRLCSIPDPGSASENLSISTPKMVSKLSEIRFGMFIPDPDFLPIPDPGVKKAPDPGSATLQLTHPSSEVLPREILSLVRSHFRAGAGNASVTGTVWATSTMLLRCRSRGIFPHAAAGTRPRKREKISSGLSDRLRYQLQRKRGEKFSFDNATHRRYW